jgi:hypothetical protein
LLFFTPFKRVIGTGAICNFAKVKPYGIYLSFATFGGIAIQPSETIAFIDDVPDAKGGKMPPIYTMLSAPSIGFADVTIIGYTDFPVFRGYNIGHIIKEAGSQVGFPVAIEVDFESVPSLLYIIHNVVDV